MKLISYAKNFEDIMLWRALHKFGPGFYIDIGAGNPLFESATKLFYENGWRGINIEPMTQSWLRIKEDRPRDINLNIAIEDKEGTGTCQSSQKKVDKVVVETTTLKKICDIYVSQEIHFLKIDVEGSEKIVLEGADFNNFRPWIILIEATKPNTQLDTYQEWENLVTKENYTFMYFDGLNRFYVANEKVELMKEAFSLPPNCFDNFQTLKEVILQEELDTLKSELEQQLFPLRKDVDAYFQESYESSRYIGFLSKEQHNLRYKLQECYAEVNALQQKNDRLKGQIEAMHQSRSWKISAPFRTLSAIFRNRVFKNA